MDHLLLSCIEYKIESNISLYGRFKLGPFRKSQSLTFANALRRTLLSELTGLAIFCVQIPGVSHEYSTLKGVKESVLDILLNLKQIVFISNKKFDQAEIGFLKVQGPAIIKSCDLKLPPSVKCVDPNQYIATLSYNGILEMKFLICEGKNFHIQTSFQSIEKNFRSHFFKTIISENFKSPANLLFIDVAFMPIKKVNFLIQNISNDYKSKNDKSTDIPAMTYLLHEFEKNSLKENLILEIWTNGSIKPKDAIYEATNKIIEIFLLFQKNFSSKKEKFFLKPIISNKAQFYSLNKIKKNSNNYLNYNLTRFKLKNLTKSQLKHVDIAYLNLSLKSYFCLKRANINTINNLLLYSRNDLLLVKNLKQKSINQIETILQKINFKLRE